MAVKLIDELQKEIKAAGEAVTQEAYEKAYDHVFQILDNLEKLLNDKDTTTISKRERLQITREKAKLEKNLGSIADLTRLPSALFIVDINKEHIAVAEAKRLNIPTFAMVDTNCDPEAVNFAIPANDDASKSIALIIDYVCQAIEEGMQERKLDKDSRMAEQAEEENDRLATELLDDEVSDEKEDNKIRKVKSVAEDTMEKRPRKQISKKGTARK